LNDRDRKAAALQSIRALKEIGTDIQWVHSYVSENRTHCVYVAGNEELIYEHAEKREFPVKKIYPVSYILEPVSAE
jgi:hypothetical protein